MEIAVKVETTNLFRYLKDRDKRLAVSTEIALNNTAKAIQQGEREHLPTVMKLRQRAFMLRNVAKIERGNFASAKRGKASVEIAVGQFPRLFLSSFEEGGIRYPVVGKRVALPVIGSPARRRIGSRVPRELTFEALAFQPGRNSAWVGQQRTYLIPKVGVFQRGVTRKGGKSGTGAGRGSTMLYAFWKPPRLRSILKFVRIARRVADERFRDEMEKQTIRALGRSLS